MPCTSTRREWATNAFSFVPDPAIARELFHSPKYPSTVGTITTSAVRTSEAFGFHARAAASLFLAYETKLLAVATRTFASGSTSPNSTVPSRSRSALTPPGATNRLSVPQMVGSRSAWKKFPGFAKTFPFGSVRSNGTTVCGSSAALVPESMITSNCASDGTPAMIPSSSS